VRLTAKGEYGVRAMINLALNYPAGPTPLSQIARMENISRQFLEQIFATLRREGLINSTRGTKGGYSLANHPENICVGDIIRALEGPIVPVDCLNERKEGEQLCSREDICLARNVWEKLRDHINNLLDNITLQDMLDCRF
jgi:Rrf2 family cysteine metabolism transcriptional repressor